MPANCFCEAIRPDVIRQPANAISGLAFIAIGLLIIKAWPRYGAMLGAATILTGAGTAVYHASLTFWGQTADVLGMYLIATFLVLYNASRIVRIPPQRAQMLYVISNALLLTALIFVPEARRYVFAGLIVGAVGLEFLARSHEPQRGAAKFLLGALMTIAIGFGVWVLDIKRIVCAPEIWLQGHAVWHLAGAASIWLIYLYYRSFDTLASPTRGP